MTMKNSNGSVMMGREDNILYFPNNIDVRMCPKNGMSTLKEAYRRVMGHTSDETLESRVKNVSLKCDMFDIPFRKGSYRIAVRRDPIDRFKSACEYIMALRSYYIKKGKFLPDIAIELDQVIDDLEQGKYSDNHFYTQTYYMGLPQDYDMVYHIDELPKLLAFLQDATECEREITNIHENKTKLKLYNGAIDPEHMTKLRNFYLKDYINGWCKQVDFIPF